MTGRVIPLGRIAGIPIRLDSSWFLIFALVTWTLAAGYYPAEFKGWPAWEYWVMGAATAAMFFVSVLLHELSHSLVARRFGTSVRSITLFIFGGVSQLGGGTTSATREFLIAAAGPAASLLLAALCWVLEAAAVGARTSPWAGSSRNSWRDTGSSTVSEASWSSATVACWVF